MASIQVKVALDKEANPSKYCPARKCLWKTFDGSYCPRHKHLEDYFLNARQSWKDSKNP